MQRKKSDIVDYKLGCSPQNYKQIFHNSPQGDCNAQLTHQSFFLKYASSIIQVINEEKLQKQNDNGAKGVVKNPAFEISEVVQHQADSLQKNCQRKTTLPNNYNHFGEVFKKKNNKKHIFTNNFTNITLFQSHLTKFQRIMLQTSFNFLKVTFHKPNTTITKNPKSRSSFHSDHTTSTSNEDQGLKKLNNLQQILKKKQDIKQSIDKMKGWLQFRLLILKSQIFKLILTTAENSVSCKKECNLMSNFSLSSFQNDQSLSLVRQEEEESLVYTADQNFQFSYKEITVLTPQKTSLEQKLNVYKDPSIAISTYGSINNHESLVEAYKFSRIKQNKFEVYKKPSISQVRPVVLKLSELRKNSVFKANTFQLPLISQFYLKDDSISEYNNPIPLNKEIYLINQIDSHLLSDQIRKQFQAIKPFGIQEIYFKKKNQQKSKANVFEEKSSTLVTQLNKNINQQNKKYGKQAQVSLQNNIFKAIIVSQQPFQTDSYKKKGFHKVQDYYFPNAQSKINKLVTSKSDTKIQDEKKITNEDQRIGFQISDKKQCIVFAKKLRFKERFADNCLHNQNNMNKSKKEVNLASNQEIESSKKIFQSKNKPNIRVGYNSPQSNMPSIPQSFTSYNVLPNDKRKPFYSPTPNFQNLEQFNSPKKPHLMPKIIQQQYNQIRPSDNQRILTKDLGFPQHAQTQDKNIYQINYLNNQPKQIVSNMGSYQKTESRNIHGSSPYRQMPQGMKIKINNQILNNRPTSRLASASPPAIHLNIPIKNEIIPYGFPTSRQNSKSKTLIQPPESQRKNLPHTNFHQQLKPHFLNYRRQDYNQDYFSKSSQGNVFDHQIVSFNYKNYPSGISIPYRSNRMISPNNIQPIFMQGSNTRRIFVSQRPHSSFRQTSERFNIFSNYSPMESQLQHIQRANNFTSSNSSELTRPKSMNEKIHVTMKRER